MHFPPRIRSEQNVSRVRSIGGHDGLLLSMCCRSSLDTPGSFQAIMEIHEVPRYCSTFLPSAQGGTGSPLLSQRPNSSISVTQASLRLGSDLSKIRQEVCQNWELAQASNHKAIVPFSSLYPLFLLWFLMSKSISHNSMSGPCQVRGMKEELIGIMLVFFYTSIAICTTSMLYQQRARQS